MRGGIVSALLPDSCLPPAVGFAIDLLTQKMTARSTAATDPTHNGSSHRPNVVEQSCIAPTCPKYRSLDAANIARWPISRMARSRTRAGIGNAPQGPHDQV